MNRRKGGGGPADGGGGKGDRENLDALTLKRKKTSQAKGVLQKPDAGNRGPTPKQKAQGGITGAEKGGNGWKKGDEKTLGGPDFKRLEGLEGKKMENQ